MGQGSHIYNNSSLSLFLVKPKKCIKYAKIKKFPEHHNMTQKCKLLPDMTFRNRAKVAIFITIHLYRYSQSNVEEA